LPRSGYKPAAQTIWELSRAQPTYRRRAGQRVGKSPVCRNAGPSAAFGARPGGPRRPSEAGPVTIAEATSAAVCAATLQRPIGDALAPSRSTAGHTISELLRRCASDRRHISASRVPACADRAFLSWPRPQVTALAVAIGARPPGTILTTAGGPISHRVVLGRCADVRWERVTPSPPSPLSRKRARGVCLLRTSSARAGPGRHERCGDPPPVLFGVRTLRQATPSTVHLARSRPSRRVSGMTASLASVCLPQGFRAIEQPEPPVPRTTIALPLATAPSGRGGGEAAGRAAAWRFSR